MNSLWTFGDSYSTYNRERQIAGVCLSIYNQTADYLSLKLKNKSISGLSNSDIFSNLLRFLPQYIKGDVIIFQLSFPNRFSYINEKKYIEFNDIESELYSHSDQYYIHPQFYHAPNREFDELEKENILKFMRGVDNNKVDYYYKYFTDLKHILNYLETLGIKSKILLLDDCNSWYNKDRFVTLKDLMIDLSIDDKLIKFDKNRYTILTAPYYKENHGYKHHHFTLDTIRQYGEDIKNNFNESEI